VAVLGRATIGLMIDWLDPGYQQVIMRGVLTAAKERDFRVVCYVTSSLEGFEGNATHKLIATGCVDGMVVAAPSLGWGSPSDRARIMTPMQPLPMCSVALDIPETSVISVNNQIGLSLLLKHLIEDHHYRNFAFVCGPEFNPDARQRLDVFRGTLAEANLEVNEKLILPGDFAPSGGLNAVNVLLGERRVNVASVDVIVAANDAMAAGVMEALEARSIGVPTQVAVTGFDDWADSRYLHSPLTTVRQPLFEQGKLAVRALTEHMRSGEPQRDSVSTEVVLRRSCGCAHGTRWATRAKSGAASQVTGFDSALVERRQLLLAELARAGRGQFGMLGAGWEMKLVSSLVEEIKGRTLAAFRDAFDGMLQRVANSGTDPAVVHEIVTVLWRHFAPCASADAELRTVLEAILDEARLATAATVQRTQGNLLVRHRNASLALIDGCARLSAVTSLGHFARLLEVHGAALRISHLDLALYPNGSQSEEAIRALTFADGRGTLASKPVRARELPRIVLSERPALPGVLVSALEFETEVLGLVVLNLGAGEGEAFEPLRASLTNAVKGAQLRDQLRQLGGHC
jgi:DNA-binding LacI/PurR family transcriptional regulator